MGLIKDIKLGFKLLKLYGKIKEAYMTKGMKTSEFWMTLLGHTITIVGALKEVIPVEWSLVASVVLQAGYDIARGLAKKNESE